MYTFICFSIFYLLCFEPQPKALKMHWLWRRIISFLSHDTPKGNWPQDVRSIIMVQYRLQFKIFSCNMFCAKILIVNFWEFDTAQLSLINKRLREFDLAKGLVGIIVGTWRKIKEIFEKSWHIVEEFCLGSFGRSLPKLEFFKMHKHFYWSF